MNVCVRSTALNSALHASVVISEEHALPDLGPFGRLGIDGRHNQVSAHTVGEYCSDGAEDQKPNAPTEVHGSPHSRMEREAPARPRSSIETRRSATHLISA